MLSADSSHIRKYLATLGLAIIAGTLSVGAFLLRVHDELLITREELRALTDSARKTVELHQQYDQFVTFALPYFIALGCLIGGGVSAFGFVGWSKRQVVTDELEDIARDKGRTELRSLSEGERRAKAESEAAGDTILKRLERSDGREGLSRSDISDSDATAPSADAGQLRASRDKTYEEIANETGISRENARRNAFLRRAVDAELVLAKKVTDALPRHRVEQAVEARTDVGRRRQIDVLATPLVEGEPTFIFEVKYSSTPTSVNARVRDAIAVVADAARMFPEAEPVVVLVHDGSVDSRHSESLSGMGNGLEASGRPVRCLVLSEQELVNMDLGDLRRFLGITAE